MIFGFKVLENIYGNSEEALRADRLFIIISYTLITMKLFIEIEKQF